MKKIICILILISAMVSFCAPSEAKEKKWQDLLNDARLLCHKGRYQKAKETTEQALKITERKFGSDSIQAAEVLLNLGAVYEIQKKYDKAQFFYNKAKAIKAKRKGTTIQYSGVYAELQKVKELIKVRKAQYDHLNRKFLITGLVCWSLALILAIRIIRQKRKQVA